METTEQNYVIVYYSLVSKWLNAFRSTDFTPVNEREVIERLTEDKLKYASFLINLIEKEKMNILDDHNAKFIWYTYRNKYKTIDDLKKLNLIND